MSQYLEMSRYPPKVYYWRTPQENALIPPKVYCRRIPQENDLIPSQLFNTSINLGSNSFFSSSDMHQFHHLSRCHATGINFSLHFTFSSSFRFPNLICQAKSVIRIIVSGSCSSKLLSRLISLGSYIKNTYSTTIKCDITRTFIKV